MVTYCYCYSYFYHSYCNCCPFVIVIPWPRLRRVDTPLPLPSQVRSSRAQEDVPRGVSPPCSWSLPPGLFILCPAHQGFGKPFSALAELRLFWVGPPLVPAGLCTPPGCLTLVLCPQGLPLWHFADLDTPEPLPSRLGLPGLRRFWTAPISFAPTGLDHLGD
jgi:hypothetical protein